MQMLRMFSPTMILMQFMGLFFLGSSGMPLALAQQVAPPLLKGNNAYQHTTTELPTLQTTTKPDSPKNNEEETDSGVSVCYPNKVSYSLNQPNYRSANYVIVVCEASNRIMHSVWGHPFIHNIYCNAVYDGYLCWPPTPAGETAYQNCPDTRMSDKNKIAYRRCGAEGYWAGKHVNDSSPIGWTNYTPCFPSHVQILLDKVYEVESEAQLKFETAANTRTIEMVGITLSLFAILVSIYIFNVFPSLHNRRTMIHRQLFYAMLTEVSVRLWLYTQQSTTILRDKETLEEHVNRGIEYLPHVCEATYVLLEYSRLGVFTWMLIEGIFLNSLISANTLRQNIPVIYLYLIGWIVPMLFVVIWAVVVAEYYYHEKINTCWYGYNYLRSYYIIQIPIFLIMMVNFTCLITIMRVIVKKLHRTTESELIKIKKSVRAALILLPLLGICNIINLIEYPIQGSSYGFAIWAYGSHFIRSFQGVFIAVIYCFTNGEVTKAVRKAWERRHFCRNLSFRLRLQRTQGDNICTIGGGHVHEEIPMTNLERYIRPSSTHNDIVSDVDAEAESSSQSELHEVVIHAPSDVHARQELPFTNLGGVPRRYSSEAPLPPPDSPIHILKYSTQYEVYFTATRRQSGPHTMPRVQRKPYVRPGLVTRDSHPTRNRSISSCF